MALGRQLAVYCLDVAVITVASLVCLTSIAVVAYGSDRDIAYLMWSLDLPFALHLQSSETLDGPPAGSRKGNCISTIAKLVAATRLGGLVK